MELFGAARCAVLQIALQKRLKAEHRAKPNISLEILLLLWHLLLLKAVIRQRYNG